MLSGTKKERLEKLRVLVVEDEMFIRNLIDHVLKDIGFTRIVLAANGKAALDILNEPESHFDFIICDWMMPEMDGLELLKHVRAMSYKTCFVMLTAKVAQTDVSDAKLEGVDAYIAKPFAPLELHRKIEALVRRMAT